MAAFEKKNDVKSCLQHNTREHPKDPSNKEIDFDRTHLNYQLTPLDHGVTAREMEKYQKKILSESYHIDSKKLVTACEWVVQAPPDLAPELKDQFFRECYNYLNQTCSGEDACLSAIVHRDEKVLDINGNLIAGADHLHYVWVPQVENKKYVSLNAKFQAGLSQINARLNLNLSSETVDRLKDIVINYEHSNSSKRENIAIQRVRDALDVSRDEARFAFGKIRRLESEKYKKRVSCDAQVDKKFLLNFHPGLSEYLDSCGIPCTVYNGGNADGRKINLTVAQLKEITKTTGVVLDKAITVDEFSKLITENRDLKIKVDALEREATRTREWGRGESVWIR